MNKKRIIGVFTGNRAEYGLLYPLIKEIGSRPSLDYRLFVSGAHLDPAFGDTLNEIKKDGFSIDAEIQIEKDSPSVALVSNTANLIGASVIEISKALVRLAPDIFVVYADRYEGFAAVIAATQLGIPTAHVEGGDLTEGGALDDSVRHAMTKLSHLHFSTNEAAANRILAMGEESWRVKNVGLLALDSIANEDYANSDEIVEKYGINLDYPILIFTQHSISTEANSALYQFEESLKAIRKLAKKGVQVLITYPNNDLGGENILKRIKEVALKGEKNIKIIPSFGRYFYHGMLALAKNPNIKIVCAGNSSSGIKETPVFKCPTVNIGSRQDGRLSSENILQAGYDSLEIELAISKALFDVKFRAVCAKASNPYYFGGAAKKITDVLESINIDKTLIQKKMMLKGLHSNGWYK